MKILVTGGAGFIGSHLCEALVRRGDDVCIVDDLNDFYDPEEKLTNLQDLKQTGRFEFVQGDVRDTSRMIAVARSHGPEIVIHLAARAGVRPSLASPALYEQVNVGGTIAMLEACRFARVRRFVLASSSSVYGATARVPFREEDSTDRPVSPYAATKAAAERVCYTYSHLYGLQVACLRFFTVYGPRQRPDLAIRKFCQNILHGKPIGVFGDGSTGRDYTYIDDIVSGIVASMADTCDYDIFNLGNSDPVLLRDLITAIETCTGKTAVIDRQPEQPGDVPITYASIDKAREFLGYSPRTKLKDGIQKVVDWCLDRDLINRVRARAAWAE